MKKQFTKEEILEAKKLMQKIAMSSNREELIAQTINDVYDPEYPVPELIQKVFNTGSADVSEHVYYFTPVLPTKEVYELSANCNVTHSKKQPGTRSELSFTPAVSPDYYVCLQDLLDGDYSVLDFYGEDILEAMNRYDIYSVLQLIDAGAVARSNTFTLDSGSTKFDFPKLVSMRKAIRKYGRKLVLISGQNVTEDIELIDYDADKNRPVTITDIVDEWISLEALDVSVGGVSKDLIDDDVAYLVAVSDSKKNKPGYFYRRKLSGSIIASSPDTQIINKERAILTTGTMKSVDTVDKFAKGIAGVEQIGAVLTNSYCVAKFTRS